MQIGVGPGSVVFEMVDQEQRLALDTIDRGAGNRQQLGAVGPCRKEWPARGVISRKRGHASLAGITSCHRTVTTPRSHPLR